MFEGNPPTHPPLHTNKSPIRVSLLAVQLSGGTLGHPTTCKLVIKEIPEGTDRLRASLLQHLAKENEDFAPRKTCSKRVFIPPLPVQKRHLSRRLTGLCHEPKPQKCFQTRLNCLQDDGHRTLPGLRSPGHPGWHRERRVRRAVGIRAVAVRALAGALEIRGQLHLTAKISSVSCCHLAQTPPCLMASLGWCPFSNTRVPFPGATNLRRAC